jgi:hypothetical protein
MSRYLAEAEDMQARVRERITRTATRVEPICLKLDGTTGVGKSAMMTTLLRDVLRIAEAPFSDEHLAVIDTGSKYMDTVTNRTQGICMDDVANTLPQFSSIDEMVHIIKIKNTIKTPVAKAAVEEKGGTFLDVKALVVSTNAPMLSADITSCEPSAILRRFAYHILVEVAPGYERDNGPNKLRMLDPSRLDAGIYSYAQTFTVREWVPNDRAGGRRDTGAFRVIHAGLNYSQLMDFLAPKIRDHFARQRAYMADMTEAQTDVLCEHGWTTARFCHVCRTANLAVEAGDSALASVGHRLRRVKAWARHAAVTWRSIAMECPDEGSVSSGRVGHLELPPLAPTAATSNLRFWDVAPVPEAWAFSAVSILRLCLFSH